MPVTETQPQKSRRGIYRLKDHYFRFWFRYLLPNRSQLEMGGAQTVLENKILSEIDHFTSIAFEEICRQYLWQAGLAGNLPFSPINIGRWWNAREEIDLVVLGEKDAIVCECKWRSRAVGIKILADLERKSEIIKQDLAGREIQYAFFSRSGFTPQLIEAATGRRDMILIELDQQLRTE